MAPENAVGACIGNLDAVIARQILDDQNWPDMVIAAQVQNFFNDLGWRLIDWVLWNGFGILQPFLSSGPIRSPPSIKAGLTDPKIAAALAHTADLISMLQNPKFTLDLSLIVCHENFLPPKLGMLSEVSREPVHFYTSGNNMIFQS